MKIQEHIEKLRAEINDLIQEALRERMQNKLTKRFRAIRKRIDELEGELAYFEDLKKESSCSDRERICSRRSKRRIQKRQR